MPADRVDVLKKKKRSVIHQLNDMKVIDLHT